MNPVIFDPETADLDAMLKRLHLANTRRQWARFCEQAEQEDWSPRRLLAVIFAEEIAQRKNTRINREVRNAGFPFLKTIDDFDFSLRSTLRLTLPGSYLGPELMSEGRCLVLDGKTGRGKTHLAVAIAYRAIQNGYSARFVTAAELIDDLSDPAHQGDFMTHTGARDVPVRTWTRNRWIVVTGSSTRSPLSRSGDEDRVRAAQARPGRRHSPRRRTRHNVPRGIWRGWQRSLPLGRRR